MIDEQFISDLTDRIKKRLFSEQGIPMTQWAEYGGLVEAYVREVVGEYQARKATPAPVTPARPIPSTPEEAQARVREILGETPRQKEVRELVEDAKAKNAEAREAASKSGKLWPADRHYRMSLNEEVLLAALHALGADIRPAEDKIGLVDVKTPYRVKGLQKHAFTPGKWQGFVPGSLEGIEWMWERPLTNKKGFTGLLVFKGIYTVYSGEGPEVTVDIPRQEIVVDPSDVERYRKDHKIEEEGVPEEFIETQIQEDINSWLDENREAWEPEEEEPEEEEPEEPEEPEEEPAPAAPAPRP
jgi:hypothetical protein